MSQFEIVEDVIYSSLGDDPDLAEIVEMFADEMPEKIAALTHCLNASDWSTMHRLAHQLKGAVGSYGFSQLTPFAARLEQSLKFHKPEYEVREAAAALIDACSRVRAGGPPTSDL